MDVTLGSAREQARLIRDGQLSARDLLEAVLDRYDRHNPALNAVVVTRIDQARDRAAEADAALAGGEVWGPLHGVPMTVKEVFDWVGTPSTWGWPELADYRPDQNAVAVDRLLDAGAVIYGKTNVPIHLADWQSYNEIYGVTNNPLGPDPNTRRFVGGFGGRLGDGHDRARARQRHRCIDQEPGALLGRVRTQADLRAGPH